MCCSGSNSPLEGSKTSGGRFEEFFNDDTVWIYEKLKKKKKRRRMKKKKQSKGGDNENANKTKKKLYKRLGNFVRNSFIRRNNSWKYAD